MVESQWGELVGFENHSGLTILNPGQGPMGKVRVGRGNNGKDGTEGASTAIAIGCYLHGSLLPKNPKLADWLIQTSMTRRHGTFALEPLDDRIGNRRPRHGSRPRRKDAVMSPAPTPAPPLTLGEGSTDERDPSPSLCPRRGQPPQPTANVGAERTTLTSPNPLARVAGEGAGR